MPEMELGPVGRMAFGLLGIVALGAGLVLAATEARWALTGAPWAWVAVIALLGVALGGGSLMRGAIRGRIRIRRQGVKRRWTF